MSRKYWVYIMCSEKNGTLYIGVTSDIMRRVQEHRDKGKHSFTARHSIGRLVYTEEYDNVADAIYREKCLKKWKRGWKMRLIEQENPEWSDLVY